jgi:DNA polymerase-3 subunit delta'
MDEGSANRIARICDGNYNAALRYAEGNDDANDKRLHRWLVCCFNLKQKNTPANAAALMDWVDEVSKIGRENQKLFLKYALFFMRECSMILFTGKSAKLENEELKFAQGLSSKLGPEQLESLSRLLNLLYYHIERNGNPKILFVSNSFRIASVFQNQEIAID